ncbi:MAG: hypothetical protein K6A44_01365 [bacterium]|nr:hypothetical protein [bacterium]
MWFFGRRKLIRTIYSFIACIIIVVYAAVSHNETMNEINNAFKTAEINAGERADDNDISSIVSNIEQSKLEILSKGIYKNEYKEGKKLVLYSGNNKTIELYKKSPEWTKKFEFVKVNTSAHEGAYSAVKKPCNGICVIDFEKKKLYSIPPEKKNDSKYLYTVFSKCYN